MQEQLDSNRLKQDLRNVVNDVEQILEDMSETAGEQVGELKSRAGRQLRDVSARLVVETRETEVSALFVGAAALLALLAAGASMFWFNRIL